MGPADPGRARPAIRSDRFLPRRSELRRSRSEPDLRPRSGRRPVRHQEGRRLCASHEDQGCNPSRLATRCSWSSALGPRPWAASLAIGMVLGPVVAGFAAWPSLHAEHATDPTSLRLLSLWWARLVDGSAFVDPAFGLFLISWLMWVTGGWLAWCVLRWRRPLLGLVPGAAGFATTLLNLPRDQNGYVLAILVLTLALLLWTNYKI